MNSEPSLPQNRMGPLMEAFEAGESPASILAQLADEHKLHNGAYVETQISLAQEDYQRKRRFLEALGMSLVQSKVAFGLGTRVRPHVPDYRLSFRTAKAVNDSDLVDIVAKSFTGTLDRDMAAVCQRQDPREHAAEMLADARGDGGFESRKSWWQIGFCDGHAACVVLPVKFQWWVEDNLSVGTFYWTGVLPQFRGRGFGTELVYRASEILRQLGIGKVFNDADTENIPMIRAFTRAGHTEAETVEKYGMYYNGQGETGR